VGRGERPQGDHLAHMPLRDAVRAAGPRRSWGGLEAPRRLEARVGPLTVTGEAREALDPNRLSRSRGWSNLTGWGDQR
jgi:hypothetical protein